MLTLRRQEKEAPTGLACWLPSTNALEQQYATDTLTDMGEGLGTDCLVWLASTEDRKRLRRKVWSGYAGAAMALAVVVMVSIASATRINCGMLVVFVLAAYIKRPAKASRLQEAAVERLADSGGLMGLPALVDALWKADSSLKEAATRGLIRLLPEMTSSTQLTERQWNILLKQINPPRFLPQKPLPNTALVVAILKATTATEYFPATEQVYRLSVTPPSLWADSIVRSVASDTYTHLKQRRNEKARTNRTVAQGQRP